MIIRLRWPVLLLVLGATWAALSLLPSNAGGGGGLSGIVVAGEPAIQAQIEAVRQFGLPLLTRTAVVQRDPDGLTVYARARAVLRALEVDKRTLTAPPGSARSDLLLALPLLNSPILLPDANEEGTTVVTYVFADPTLGFSEQDRLARGYAAGIDRPDDALVGVAGTIPIQVQQARLVGEALPLVELATVLAIALIVGLNFRSVVAPALTLLTATIAYLISDRMIGWLAGLLGFTAPAELRPIVVALTLGIVTDYTIFFLSGQQRHLIEGTPGRAAARRSVAEYLPIVLAAGLIVAAGMLSLVVAEFGLFRAFGPGLAVTVLVGLAVSVTMVPAMLAIVGRWAFWPSRVADRSEGEPVGPAPAGLAALVRPVRLARLVRRLGDRRVAAGLAGGLIAVMAFAIAPLTGLRTAVSPADALPPGDPVRLATEAAAAGITPGVLGPTEVIIGRPGITSARTQLAALAEELELQPGVADVIGPDDQPLPIELGLFLAPDGAGARYLVVFDSDPLGATALGHLRQLRERMPLLLAEADLAGAQVTFAGDSALGLSLVEQAEADLLRVALAVGLVDLLLLVLFLRALVAPLYLLFTSVLAVGAALGLTTLVFQGWFGQDGLIFYVPFAAAVLLVSLGSDYNIFSVGYIWDEARRRPLPDALAVAVPRSARAINAAGVTLAVSFALVALIPVAPFKELAFAIAVGVLIDAFVVRSLLVPALISLVGRRSGWPGRRLAPAPDA